MSARAVGMRRAARVLAIAASLLLAGCPPLRQPPAELGPRFDLREFHAAVLEDGALPMDVLEAKIGRWIERRQVPGGE